MALTTLHIADKSALARLHHEAVYERVAPLVEAGTVATCAIIELEVLYSARSPSDYDETWALRRAAYRWLPVTDADHLRALDVQRVLAGGGRHRAVAIPDLIIAAVAESAGATVLHYDRDFDLIADVTGQMCSWVVPPGTVP